MLKRFFPLFLLPLAACSHEHRVVHHMPIPIPLVYMPGVEPISAEERGEIASRVPPRMPPVWFILILANTPMRGGSPHVDAEICFIPDQQAIIRSLEITPIPGNHILRQGRYLAVSDASNGAGPPLSYMQVPFTGRAPNPVLVPTLAEIPFPRPAGVPDDTVVELILLARSTYAAHGIPADAPILGIDRSGLFPNAFLIRVAAAPSEIRTLTVRQFKGYFTIDR